jgi:hypothetical protein
MRGAPQQNVETAIWLVLVPASYGIFKEKEP